MEAGAFDCRSVSAICFFVGFMSSPVDNAIVGACFDGSSIRESHDGILYPYDGMLGGCDELIGDVCPSSSFNACPVSTHDDSIVTDTRREDRKVSACQLNSGPRYRHEQQHGDKQREEKGSSVSNFENL